MERAVAVTRLDTIEALEEIFDRANDGTSAGAWTVDQGGSTGTSNTGPGSNSPGPYVYSETTGAGSEDDIQANSTLTVKSEVMAAWTGAGRLLRFQAVIAGAGWVDTGEGLEILGRPTASDDWESIKLFSGWDYSDTYAATDTFTDRDGETRTCVRDGGWVDFEVTIPDGHTEVQMRSKPVMMTDSGRPFQHDAALWQIELRDGSRGPTVDITTSDQEADAGAQVSLAAVASGAGLTYAWSVMPPGGSFADDKARDTIWTAPSRAVATEYALTLTITDDSNREASDTVTIKVAAAPAEAEILPALTASIDGAARWPGGLVAEVESYGATMFGGPEAATLNAAGPETGLRWLLTQLRRPLQLQGKQAGPVWWGYVHRVEVRLGAVTATASLDGLRTAIAVTHPDGETGTAERSEFHLAQPAAEQYGRVEILREAENADGVTEEALAEMLAPHLAVARGMEVGDRLATGARLYARGWNAVLNWRFAPRHSDHARFGDAMQQGGALGRPAIGTAANEVEWAAWCDFGPQGHPGYDLYLDSARLAITGPADNPTSVAAGYSDDWKAGVRARARAMSGDPAVNDPTGGDAPTDRIGEEIAFDASDLPRVSQSAPYDVLNGEAPRLVELDFGGQEILLPEAGFFLTVRAALTHQFQYAVADNAENVWSDDTAGAAWSWGHDGSSWTQAGTQRPVYDFLARAKAPGLLRMLLDGHDVLRAGPAPDGAGGQTYPLHLEGRETVAQRLAEVRGAERLGYLVDATRTVRFFTSGESVWRLGRDGRWRSKAARGAMPFLGQYVRTEGSETALCESATFTPRTGLWELGYRRNGRGQGLGARG